MNINCLNENMMNAIFKCVKSFDIVYMLIRNELIFVIGWILFITLFISANLVMRNK